MTGLSPFALGFLAPLAVAIFGVGGMIVLFWFAVNLPEPVTNAALMLIAAGLLAFLVGTVIGFGTAVVVGEWDTGDCGPFDDIDTCESGGLTDAGQNIMIGAISSTFLVIAALFGYQLYNERRRSDTDSKGANNAA